MAKISQIQRITMRWYLRLVLIEDLALFIFLASIPGDPKNAWILGMSRSRVVMLSLVTLMTLAALVLAIQERINKDWIEKNIQRLALFVDRERIYLAVIIALGVVGTAGVIALRFGSISTDEFIRGYYIRLRPLVLWMVIVSIQSLIALRVFRSGWGWGGFDVERKNFLSVLLPMGLVAGFSLWMVSGKISVVKDFYAWGDPGVPILGEQVLLALGAALVLALVSAFLTWAAALNSSWKLAGLPVFKRQVIMALVLWVAAIWVWSSSDLLPSYFSPNPRPPNFEYYPYSDASLYDRSAQRLLIGEGFEPTVRRPLYSAFLALAQALSGIGMDSVIQWQIPVLALIPVLLYLLTERLHHHLSALLAALLVIFHEVNAIALAGVVNVSHAKLLMSDLPTALGVIGFTYASVKWMKSEGERPYLPLIAGGLIGLTILVRVQAIIILPPVVVLAWFVTSKPPRVRFKDTLILIVGLMLVAGPWVFRNWHRTGVMSFGTDSSQTGLIKQRYRLIEDDKAGNPDEVHIQDDSSTSVLEGVWTFVSQNPGEFLQFTSAHFANNQIATLLVLPAKIGFVENLKTYYELSPFWDGPGSKLWEQCCWRSAYVADLPYWDNWDGVLGRASKLPVILNLIIISIGIGVLWSQHGITGMVPLVVALSYSLGNSLIRNSGWRFNLPVDWIGIFLYAVGVVQIILWVGGWMVNHSLSSSSNSIDTGSNPRQTKLIMGISCLFFFGISSAIPFAEMVIQPRYDPDSLSQALVEIKDELSIAGLDSGALLEGLESGKLTRLVGRALYPRFYPANEGEPGSGWPAFDSREYSRLGFLVVGPRDFQVVLPVSDPPDAFAHGVDVLVFGCIQNDLLIASLVVELEGNPKGILQSVTPVWNCP